MEPLGIVDPSLQRLYRYWEQKRGTRICPARRDIDPLDFSYILGWVMLLDVSGKPPQFSYRLHGTEVARQEGVELTGKRLADHPHPETRAHLEEVWRKVVEQGVPSHELSERPTYFEPRPFEVLRLPLSSDGTVIDMLLVAVSPHTFAR
jgi:hypothetical protein